MVYQGTKIEYDHEVGVYYATFDGEYIEEEKLTDMKSMVYAMDISNGDYRFALEVRGMDEEEIELIFNRYQYEY
jgi:hypothetical protein